MDSIYATLRAFVFSTFLSSLTRFAIAHACFAGLPTLKHVSLAYSTCYIRDIQNFYAAMKFSAEPAIHLVNAISVRLRGVEGTTKLAAASISFPRDNDLT
ncbi:hypothetical protein GGX14DRAFT_574676 [Mycena pura]|uniref:Uncharacterized protein n=1 Tax=Mycena pura TaxID=153505 RepID=A0AAD6Y500_9AGAR|nr:hypothetical protein GGX14DRAFT_574676 [Mycena pura]